MPFRFQREQEKRTSHFLIFVSKNARGYEITKEIMAAESSLADQGVPSFTYFPADKSTPLLFSFSRPLDVLEDDLPEKFAGRRLTMKEIFEEHNVDTLYIKRNYQAALRNLEAAKKIACKPPADQRRKIRGDVTFADHVVVSFPRRR